MVVGPKRFIRIAGILIAVLSLGWWFPQKFISDGMTAITTRTEQIVAGEAYLITELMVYDNPLARLVVTGLRVVRIEHLPGNCPPNEAKRGYSHMDYRAELRAYGPFGIPLRTYYGLCGGNYVTVAPASAD
jgi:hypothetical protein